MKNLKQYQAANTAFEDMKKEGQEFNPDFHELMLSTGMNNPGFKRTNHSKKY